MEPKYEASDLMDLTKPELIAIILKQQDIIIHLEERIRALEEMMHKDSHNSHTPPSQSPHVTIKNLREKTGKIRGGQTGHPGKTLEMVSQPTYIVAYKVTRCDRCGKELSAIPAEGYERRQVFDIPPIVCEVTEYQAEKKRCSCGHLTTALFPETVNAPVQYGINIQCLLTILSAYEYLSYNRISELTEQLTGYRVNESTVYSFQDKLYENLVDFEEKSKLQLTQSEVIHNDETGIAVEGKRRWLHLSATSELTHYAVDTKRGKEATDRIGILPLFHGTSIHDGWKPYFGYKECRHGLCNAHHLRELTFFGEEEKAAWATSLKNLLLSAKAKVAKARDESQAHLDLVSLQSIEGQYREILEAAMRVNGEAAKASQPPAVKTGRKGRLKKTKQQNFIERLLEYKESVLAFVYDFRVPFDNNLAERDIRMMKLKDKVSGTFRSPHGADCFARIRGYISTVRKNGGNVFEEIKNAFCGQPFLLQNW
jgi:transposase